VPNLLQIRTELFEHGLFPMQSKLSSSVLVTTFTNLNLLSSIDYKIRLSNWVDQSKKHIPDMTEQDAQIFFLTYKALLEDVDNPPIGSTPAALLHYQAANRDAPIADY
jgi:hypothetical protein